MKRRTFFGALAGAAAVAAAAPSSAAPVDYLPEIIPLNPLYDIDPSAEVVLLEYRQNHYGFEVLVHSERRLPSGLSTVRLPVWADGGFGELCLTDSGRWRDGRRIFA